MSLMKENTLSILVPVYNEENTIIEVLNRILAAELINEVKKQIIIINDGSKDSSEKLILQFQKQHSEHSIVYIKHAENKGKGASIHTGLNITTGAFIIVQDADLEYDPQEYNILLKPIIDGYADVVFGSRFSGGSPHRILFFWHSIGNKLLTFLSNAFTNLNLTDMETCYKLFKSNIIKSIQLEEERFGFEPEVTAKVSKIPNIRIYEVGISYYGRTYNEGKKINWKDGVRAIFSIIKYNLFSK